MNIESELIEKYGSLHNAAQAFILNHRAFHGPFVTGDTVEGFLKCLQETVDAEEKNNETS